MCCSTSTASGGERQVRPPLPVTIFWSRSQAACNVARARVRACRAHRRRRVRAGDGQSGAPRRCAGNRRAPRRGLRRALPDRGPPDRWRNQRRDRAGAARRQHAARHHEERRCRALSRQESRPRHDPLLRDQRRSLIARPQGAASGSRRRDRARRTLPRVPAVP